MHAALSAAQLQCGAAGAAHIISNQQGAPSFTNAVAVVQTTSDWERLDAQLAAAAQSGVWLRNLFWSA